MSETRARSPRKKAARIATTETALTPTISHDAIAERAYELSQADDGGSPEQHWLRAEQELRDSAGA